MNRRHRTRRAALQALYQWDATGRPAGEIVVEFDDEERLAGVDRERFKRLVLGVAEHREAIDAALAPALDRPIAQLDPVERAILRLAGFELAHCPEVPWRVVINEAVELAHAFGAEQSHRYVNGVLDRLAAARRAVEG